jgi:elongator complex protein 2
MAQVKANYNLDFISVGCNRVTNGVDWGFNNLIVYAAHKFVAIFDPDDGKIIATLPGHKNRVNCVKWLPNVEAEYATRWQQKEVEIASASADRNVVIWKYRPESGKYQASAVLTGHEDSVNSLAVLDLEDGTLLLASCSGDRTVRIWKRTSPKAGT